MRWDARVGSYMVYGDVERIFGVDNLKGLSEKQVNRLTMILEETIVDRYAGPDYFCEEEITDMLDRVKNGG